MDGLIFDKFIHFSPNERKIYFTPFFSIDQLVKGDKTGLLFDRAAASMQIGDRLKNVAENIKSVHIESKKEKNTFE